MAGGGVDREAFSAALDAMDAAFARVAEFDCEALTTREQLGLLERFAAAGEVRWPGSLR